MTAIQICALISIVIAAVILYWVGYRGGLTDGKNDGYDEAHSDGYVLGRDEASAASKRCQINACAPNSY